MAALIGVAMLVTIAAQSDDVETLAAQTGVDPVDLAGAVNSTGLAPRDYMLGVGEMDAPAPATPAPSTSVGGVWLALANCESGGNWRANTGNSYYGGLQQDLSFWRRYGGTVYAARPDLASREAQVAVAQRGLAVQGWGAWPACSRRLGLR